MSKIKNGGLDQYGTGPFEQQQFGTAVGEGVNPHYLFSATFAKWRIRIAYPLHTQAPPIERR